MTQAADPQNQRQHKRLKERIDVQFKLVGSSEVIRDMQYRKAQTRDISAGGVFIELLDTHLTKQNQSIVDDFLLFKNQIDLLISMPTKQQPIHAAGKAVWIEKEVPGREYRHGIAICFTEVDPEDKEFINQFVLSRL
ncbi:MAG: PilZ domain-containing protein [Candidatus Omnitrophica bacterium]|nr:PilZ domain-containing protein [Candidatus Omnitrophota bacterium]